MSLFSWFSRKPPSQEHGVFESSMMGLTAASGPAALSGTAASGKVGSHALTGNAANRKTERLERRELLYTVVREAMTRAGVLSASYKFKVLSLDPRGRQYLIMMDLANSSAGEAGRLADIEAVITQNAKRRHDILVTAVYWRINPQVMAGLSGLNAASVTAAPPPPPLPRRASAGQRAAGHANGQVAEAGAFKNTLASATSGVGLVGSGEIVSAAASDFQDTEVAHREERVSPLSGTQYGDLV